MTQLRFQARVENGTLVSTEDINLQVEAKSGTTYWVTIELRGEPTLGANALAELAALAQPLGPANLARNFDTYTKRVLRDESTE